MPAETSDGRYVKTGSGNWWDIRTVQIVPEEVVLDHLKSNGPKVSLLHWEEGEHR